MAAPVLQSTQVSTLANVAHGASVSVTKPTSLAVGDLMIACAVSNLGVLTLPSGFVSLGTQGDGVVDSGQMVSELAWKIADSSDVAASTFAFSNNSGVSRLSFAAISRITGASAASVSYMYGEGSATNTSTPSIAAGVTPKDYGDSVLLIMYWVARTASTATASYAIGTSNPSWSEGYDVASGSGENVSMAYATRPELTATGNVSCAGGGGTTDWGVQLLAIPAPLRATVTETVTLTESKILSMSQLVSETATLTESVDADTQRQWTNTSKNNASWVNTDKS